MKLAAHGPLSVRFQTKGTMFGLLQQSDSQVISTQYGLARATSESPTIIAPSGTPFFETMKEDFEWQWDRAEPAG